MEKFFFDLKEDTFESALINKMQDISSLLH